MKGDIDGVLQERNRSGYDVSSLKDESQFDQTAMFSVAKIPDDNQAVQMAKILKEMGVNPSKTDTLE